MLGALYFSAKELARSRIRSVLGVMPERSFNMVPLAFMIKS